MPGLGLGILGRKGLSQSQIMPRPNCQESWGCRPPAYTCAHTHHSAVGEATPSSSAQVVDIWGPSQLA